VDIDPNCTGADCYEESISTCAGVQHTIGDTLRTEPGSMVGPTKFGSNDLVAQDPNAYFDTSTGKVMKPGPNGPVDDSSSPRIIPLAMFSPEEFANLDRTSGRFDLHIVNMLGFFLEGVDNQGYVRGVIVLKIDNFIGSGGVPGSNAAFLKTIALVR
jgi:hypothetical protein